MKKFVLIFIVLVAILIGVILAWKFYQKEMVGKKELPVGTSWPLGEKSGFVSDLDDPFNKYRAPKEELIEQSKTNPGLIDLAAFYDIFGQIISIETTEKGGILTIQANRPLPKNYKLIVDGETIIADLLVISNNLAKIEKKNPDFNSLNAGSYLRAKFKEDPADSALDIFTAVFIQPLAYE